MQDGICSEPAFPTHIDPPFRLEYRLGIDDFIAYWIYLACKIPKRLPLRIEDRLAMIRLVFDGCVFCGALTIFTFFFVKRIGRTIEPDTNFDLPTMIFWFNIWLVFFCRPPSILAWPKSFLKGPLARPTRWLCSFALRNLAKAKVRGGALDTISSYRVVVTPEGIIQTAERLTTREELKAVLYSREEKLSWAAVEIIGEDEERIFLITDNSIPVIVPRSTFPHEKTAESFLQMARRYREARGVFLSTSADAVGDLTAPSHAMSPAIQTGPNGQRPF